MKINQGARVNRRRRPLVGVAVAGAALAAGAVASAGSATATAGEQVASAPGSGSGTFTAQASPGTVNYAGSSLVRADPLPVNRVKVRDALLRSQPNRTSTKLDVSQPGRGLTLYCWVPGGSGDGGLIWFKTHPWGSRFIGWMRADLVHWGSYPYPGRC